MLIEFPFIHYKISSFEHKNKPYNFFCFLLVLVCIGWWLVAINYHSHSCSSPILIVCKKLCLPSAHRVPGHQFLQSGREASSCSRRMVGRSSSCCILKVWRTGWICFLEPFSSRSISGKASVPETVIILDSWPHICSVLVGGRILTVFVLCVLSYSSQQLSLSVCGVSNRCRLKRKHS